MHRAAEDIPQCVQHHSHKHTRTRLSLSSLYVYMHRKGECLSVPPWSHSADTAGPRVMVAIQIKKINTAVVSLHSAELVTGHLSILQSAPRGPPLWVNRRFTLRPLLVRLPGASHDAHKPMHGRPVPPQAFPSTTN